MFNIDANKLITLTRGDSCVLSFDINIGSAVNPIPYIPEEGDTLYFGVMEPNKPFECGLIRKVLTVDDCEGDIVIIKFKPEDTEFVLPGVYHYSLKLLKGGTDVYTIIDKKKFTIID